MPAPMPVCRNRRRSLRPNLRARCEAEPPGRRVNRRERPGNAAAASRNTLAHRDVVRFSGAGPYKEKIQSAADFKSGALRLLRAYPNVDHIQAVSRGGARLESHNHVTACTKCNEQKGDRSGWTPGPIRKDEWDGLVSLYRPLAKRLENVRQYHNDWFRDLKI